MKGVQWIAILGLAASSVFQMLSISALRGEIRSQGDDIGHLADASLKNSSSIESLNSSIEILESTIRLLAKRGQ